MYKRVNAGRGFDYQLKPCDFGKWVKYDSLPIEQACFVLLGYEPFPLEVTNAKPIPYLERRLPSWERPPVFDDALALLKNSIQNGNVQSEPSMDGQYFARQIKWPALISWAKSKRYAIPPELEGNIELSPEPMQAQNAATPAPVVVTDWRNTVRAEAWEQWVKTLAKNGTPTLENVSVYLASWCEARHLTTDMGNLPKSSYIKMHVIDGKHWAPPRNMSREAAKKHLEQKEHAKQAN